jgi:hypothetical protein
MVGFLPTSRYTITIDSMKTISKLRGSRSPERRTRRATDVLEALNLQLDACRDDGDLAAMVVADEYGLCLASSGLTHTCYEIAARLPILARKAGDFAGVLLGASGGVPVAMKRIQVDGTELYACAVGGNQQKHSTELRRAEHP